MGNRFFQIENLDQVREKIKKRQKNFTIIVDITNLLMFPQKIAAKILCISESMLCKIFKSQTDNKKWPYRKTQCILNKILNLKNDTTNIQKNMTEIHKLEKSVEECLQPITLELASTSFLGKRIKKFV